ncbi:MAG: hypothetical protein GTO14_00045 [Anaerolineales bacterium]|nr:hypothetical protein [Anaerolineales bacterium]
MAFAQVEGYLSNEVQKVCRMLFGGLCDLGSNCGTLLGGLTIMGVRESHVAPSEKSGRENAQSMGVELILWFEEEFGSTNCEEIININFQEPDRKDRYASENVLDQVCSLWYAKLVTG